MPHVHVPFYAPDDLRDLRRELRRIGPGFEGINPGWQLGQVGDSQTLTAERPGTHPSMVAANSIEGLLEAVRQREAQISGNVTPTA